jgi:peroxiredoxin
MRNILTLTLLLLILSPLFAQHAARADSAQGSLKSAPEFTLPDINGKKVSLSDFKGKVILLNFWATWCGPCTGEMPSLNNLYAAFKNEGFVVLAVSIDPSERAVQSFVSAKGITFPVLMDPDKEAYFDLYAVFALPTSFLIDRKGMIVAKILGDREWDSPDMKNKIADLLKQRAQKKTE